MKIPASLCIKCKGTRKLCGLPECPLLAEHRNRLKIISLVENRKEIQGATPPSFLVGEKNYPSVVYFYNIAPEKTSLEAKEYEDPTGWWGRKSLMDILKLRTSMLSGLVRINVKDHWVLYTKEYGLASISEKPVDSEITLLKKPRSKPSFDAILKPLGFSSPAKQIIVVENPKLNKKVEELIWDDVVAYQGLIEGYKSGLDVYSLVKIFSLGFIGRLKHRRIVPTRWAITAVDDIVSHHLRKRIIDYKTIDDYRIYFSEYLYNRFTIILMPGVYEAHWFEIWNPRSIWVSKGGSPEILYIKEDWRGVSKPRDGGFSAARLAVLEYMEKNRIQARAVIIREVLPEYIIPVGNWHIRETVRKALLNPYEKTIDIKLLLDKVGKKLVYKEFLNYFKTKVDKWLSQKHIDEYFMG